MQRDWYVALRPGLRLSPSTSVYLSIAHHRGSARLDDRTDALCDSSGCLFGNTISFRRKLEGTGVGLGIQSALSDTWFVRAEVERIDFDRVDFSNGDVGNASNFFGTNQLKASETIGRVVIGRRF